MYTRNYPLILPLLVTCHLIATVCDLSVPRFNKSPPDRETKNIYAPAGDSVTRELK
jgi:hypothetical protein